MNIFENIPAKLSDEIFETLEKYKSIKIERIISKGHTTPEGEWYDQEKGEWVIVLKGTGIIAYEDGHSIKLSSGDYVNIPARCKHRVDWTDSETETIWLAIFYEE